MRVCVHTFDHKIRKVRPFFCRYMKPDTDEHVRFLVTRFGCCERALLLYFVRIINIYTYLYVYTEIDCCWSVCTPFDKQLSEWWFSFLYFCLLGLWIQNEHYRHKFFAMAQTTSLKKNGAATVLAKAKSCQMV